MGPISACEAKLLGRREGVYGPTPGPAIPEPQDYVRTFIAHRREREAGILECLRAGVGRIEEIVERLYTGLQPGLRRAAGRSVYAHLIDLIGRGIVESDGPPALDAHYRMARN